MPSFEQAFGALQRAHGRFHTRALKTLFPELGGTARAVAIAREHHRGDTYLSRAHDRLRTGLRQINTDPTLTRPQREQRGRALVQREQRFFAQHMAATADRMRRDADLNALDRDRQEYGLWLMDPNKRSHTPACEALHGRLWPVPFLRAMGPHHPGCGCRVRDPEYGLARGFRPVHGLISPALRDVLLRESDVLEELDVPVWPGAHHVRSYVKADGTRVSGYERVTHAHGDVHPRLERPMRHMLDAIHHGDLEAVDEHRAELIARAKRLPPRKRDEQLRLIDRVYARAIHPSGANVPYGTRVERDGWEVPVPVGTTEREGLQRGWAHGTYRWHIPDTTLADPVIAALRRNKTLELTRIEGGWSMRIKPGLSPVEKRRDAVALEVSLPELRQHRTITDTEAFGDDQPLDLPRSARFAHVSTKAIGDTAELAVPDIAQRLVALHSEDVGDPKDFEPISILNRRGMAETPLDARIGRLGLEIKGISFRGLTAHRSDDSPSSISPRQRAEKIASCAAKGHLQPALVQTVVDYDHNRVHQFLLIYPGHWDGDHWVSDTGTPAFGEKRVPLRMVEALVDGELTPGQQVRPRGARKGADAPWTYLGTFTARFNPLSARDSPRPDVQRAGKLPTRELRRRIAAPAPPAADVLPDDARISPAAKRAGKVAGKRVAAAKQDEELTRRAVELAGQDYTQAEIGDELGISQSKVSKLLLNAGVKRGRGTRTDRAARRRR